MANDNLVKAAEFRRELGYLNKTNYINDERIISCYKDITTINKINRLMQQWRIKKLLDNPAETITKINELLNSFSVNLNNSRRPLYDMIIKYSKEKDLVVMPMYNIVLQDIMNMLQTGVYINLTKYLYLTDKEFVLTTFNYLEYKDNLSIKVPEKSPELPDTDIEILLQTIGIKDSVLLLGILVHFGLFKL